MCIKRMFVTICFLVAGEVVSIGQPSDTIDLFTCYRMVRANAPQLRQLAINNERKSVEINKLTASNLPVVSGFGKATYQSDALSMSAAAPMAPSVEVDLFQYNAGVGIDQKLFDGGLNGIQKEIRRIESEIDNLEAEVAIYKYYELANRYFFGVATLERSELVLQLRLATLAERFRLMESGVRNGTVASAELERVGVEILATRQQQTEAGMALRQMSQNLKTLTGLADTVVVVWLLPVSVTVPDSQQRCETRIFEQNRRYAESMIKLQGRRYTPRLSAFGQAGYSYPGLNMFENEPAAYYMVGMNLSWTLFDWQMADKEKKLLKLQVQQIDIAEAEFDRQLRMLSDAEQVQMQHTHQLIEDDLKIIASREKITRASGSALDNGTITTADYLADLNAETKARFDYEKHKIALAESKARLAIIKGIHVGF